jgi:hypothetical protein
MMSNIDGAMRNGVTEDGLDFEPSTEVMRDVHMCLGKNASGNAAYT